MKTKKTTTPAASKRRVRPIIGANHPIRISAKTLGALALRGFCERCFWLQLHHRLPYQIFPGIFSSIDSYTKKIVHGWFDAQHEAPVWLHQLGDVATYHEPPHWSKFNVLSHHGILLTGTPDGVFVLRDKSHLIVDYKTARFTGTQDELLPMYAVQLNVYALIGQHYGFDPVSSLALIYMEPRTEGCDWCARCQRDGFDMGFAARVLPVALNTGMLEPLLARAADIYNSPAPPAACTGCKNCGLLEELLHALHRRRRA